MRIYSINVNGLSDEELRRGFEQMSDGRKESVMRMHNKKKRNLRICADMLCRKAIAEFCGVNTDEIRFTLSPSGKPYVNNLPVYFSISHSGNLAVCAVSEKEIGIDIEKTRELHPRISEKFCTESEAEYIRTAENGIFRIWTLKEAYFKCIGTGLGTDIKNVSFSVSDNKITCSENGFELSFIHIEDGYVCSVCEKAVQQQ